jgi:hypothetical protein
MVDEPQENLDEQEPEAPSLEFPPVDLPAEPVESVDPELSVPEIESPEPAEAEPVEFPELPLLELDAPEFEPAEVEGEPMPEPEPEQPQPPVSDVEWPEVALPDAEDSEVLEPAAYADPFIADWMRGENPLVLGGEDIDATTGPAGSSVSVPFVDTDDSELLSGESAGTADTPAVLLPVDHATVAAQEDDWDRTAPPEGTDGVELYSVTRHVWDDSTPTAPKWYEYYRVWTFDSAGKLLTVSAETRREVATPADCTAAGS